MTKICIIACMDPNRTIGRRGELPWYLPEDRTHFKNITTGHPIIMGSRTFDHILSLNGRPLPKRISCILSHNPFFALRYPTVWQLKVAMTLESAVKLFEDREKVFIIGGGNVFSQSVDLADELYITRTHQEFEGDTFFPDIDYTKYEELSKQIDKNVSYYHYKRLECITQTLTQ